MITQMASLPSDHLELISRACSAMTIDPYKNIVYYVFPFIRAFFSDYHKLQNDPSQEAMMPQQATEIALKEIKELTRCAGIGREVRSYIGLVHQFSSCGGPYSITKPSLFLPYQHLFHNGAGGLWSFSGDETRFLIARELGQIKENSALLKIAIKVIAIAAVFTIYGTPFGWPMGISLFAGVLGMYIISEKFFQARADIVGVEILAKRNPNAKQIAIDTLEKMRQQNLYRHEHSSLARCYITASGNNVLDFTHPYLTTRIQALNLID